MRAAGKGDDLTRDLRGKVDFISRNGRIYEGGFLARILDFLNITEVLFGKLPDMAKEGFGYNSITVKGSIQRGKMTLEEAVMDGSSLGLAAQGDLDLAKKQVDLVVLASPLRTVDRIIRYIPLVRSILGGTLVALPIKVSGDMADPKITYISPSAIGTRLLNIMEKIIKIPLKIVEPVIPGKTEERGQ